MFKQKKYLKGNQEYLNTLNLIFYLAVAIPMAPFTYSYLNLTKTNSLTATFPDRPDVLIFYVLPLIIFALLVISIFVYRSDLHKVSETNTFEEKLIFFFKFSFKKYLFIELASLGVIIGFYLTHQKFFATLYVITLLMFSFNRPTVNRIAKDMKLTKTEKEKLYGDQKF